MPHFYKGVRVGTVPHGIDFRVTGIQPRNPGASYSIAALMDHIAGTTHMSPLISLTRSYGVAEMYARDGALSLSTTQPSYVYVINIDDSSPSGIIVKDPIFEVADSVKNPLVSPSYHHDGDRTFILGVANPTAMYRYLTNPAPQPPGQMAKVPNLTRELQALVRALRDAEVLIHGSIPAACVVDRHPIY
jgi:hypothetical protein